ncbi:uncharacterized protein [Parasteatoda tepidariorum]|uniref:uncharacterized protein n=1 Tax=Parasteatoda tepidariorum TaxID=114398 RepID=UPI00077FD9F2|nr:uncharacterized protein LOC107457086 [Parasteatoda tepidariorum]
MIAVWNMILFLLYDAVSSEWATIKEKEGTEKAIQCYSDMLINGDISHLFLDVTSPEKIDAFCGRISRLRKCIAENEHHLSVPQNTQYLQKVRGVETFYLNVCPPGTEITTQYKGNSPCFQLIKKEILFCGSDLPDVSSYAMQYEETTRCCALKSHRECMYKAVSGYCGTDAGDVTTKILVKFFHPQLKGCDKVYPRCQEHGFTDSSDVRQTYNPYGPDDIGPRTPNRRFYGNHPEPRETESEGSWKDHETVDRKKCKSNGNSVYGITSSISSFCVIFLQLLCTRYYWF